MGCCVQRRGLERRWPEEWRWARTCSDIFGGVDSGAQYAGFSVGGDEISCYTQMKV